MYHSGNPRNRTTVQKEKITCPRWRSSGRVGLVSSFFGDGSAAFVSPAGSGGFGSPIIVESRNEWCYRSALCMCDCTGRASFWALKSSCGQWSRVSVHNLKVRINRFLAKDTFHHSFRSRDTPG